jgi:2-iminobutanoate/2-iminopropanoate deaminase
VKTRFCNLPSLKPGSGYSDLVIAGDFAYVAGKIAADRQSGFTLGSIEDETRQCMELIRDTLALEGLRVGDIVKVNIFMKHLHEFDRMNSVYRGFFAGGREPARTTVGVADVLFGCRIEIECIARLPRPSHDNGQA